MRNARGIGKIVLGAGEQQSKAVGIWIRVSTEDQARGESPEHHEKRARHYAEAKGWIVRELYNLTGVSGKSVMEHPEARRMLADVTNGRITGLIFSKLARLARNTRELLEFSDIFRQHGADLISLQEAIDTTSPAGRLLYTMISALAQWEREEIAERVAVSVPIRAKLGKPLGGQASFGYRWDGHRLVPDLQEAPIRKLMYELFLEHRRKKKVARLLNERGYRTRNGSRFSDTTLDRLIRDPAAKGEHRSNYTRSTGNKSHWELKPESEWVINKVESIVSAELWAQCNAILDEQRKKLARASRPTVHLFAGFTYCGCGHKMYVPSNTPKYVCQRCRNKIATNELEKAFVGELESFLCSPQEIADHLREADTVIKGKEELLRVLDTELKGIKQEMEKVYRLYIDDKLSPDGFSEKYRPLELRRKQIENEIPQLQAEVDVLKINYLSSEEIVAEAKDLYSHWPEFDSESKRRIIESVTERIEIGKDEIAIHLLYLPSATRPSPPVTPPHGNRGERATQPHGFMAATSWTRAG